MLTRTFYILLDLIHTQEEYAKLKQSSVRTFNSSRETLSQYIILFNQGGKSAGGDQAKQIQELKTKLAAAEKKAADYGECYLSFPPRSVN